MSQDVPALIGPGERVLEDLLGCLPVAGQAVRRPVDRRAIADEEGLERVDVVGLHPAQELSLLGPDPAAGRVLDGLARRVVLRVGHGRSRRGLS